MKTAKYCLFMILVISDFKYTQEEGSVSRNKDPKAYIQVSVLPKDIEVGGRPTSNFTCDVKGLGLSETVSNEIITWYCWEPGKDPDIIYCDFELKQNLLRIGRYTMIKLSETSCRLKWTNIAANITCKCLYGSLEEDTNSIIVSAINMDIMSTTLSAHPLHMNNTNLFIGLVVLEIIVTMLVIVFLAYFCRKCFCKQTDCNGVRNAFIKCCPECYSCECAKNPVKSPRIYPGGNMKGSERCKYIPKANADPKAILLKVKELANSNAEVDGSYEPILENPLRVMIESSQQTENFENNLEKKSFHAPKDNLLTEKTFSRVNESREDKNLDSAISLNARNNFSENEKPKVLKKRPSDLDQTSTLPRKKIISLTIPECLEFTAEEYDGEHAEKFLESLSNNLKENFSKIGAQLAISNTTEPNKITKEKSYPAHKDICTSIRDGMPIAIRSTPNTDLNKAADRKEDSGYKTLSSVTDGDTPVGLQSEKEKDLSETLSKPNTKIRGKRRRNPRYRSLPNPNRDDSAIDSADEESIKYSQDGQGRLSGEKLSDIKK